MHGKSTFNTFRSPKPDIFVGDLTIVTDTPAATAGTLKSWVSSVAVDSSVYTVTFNSGVTFPTTPVFTVNAVSTNATPLKAFATITQQYNSTTRTLKFTLCLDTGTYVTPAADVFANITIMGTINGGMP
jgi:hypothetical protein